MLGTWQLGTNQLGTSPSQESEPEKYAHGQAQAAILSVYRGHAQAQARVKQTYYAHSQANALIGTKVSVHGQSQASILQTYRGFAQAQAEIDADPPLFGHGQAQAFIATILVSDSFTRVATDDLGTPDIGPAYLISSADQESDTSINGTYLTGTNPTLDWYAWGESDIDFSHGESQIDFRTSATTDYGVSLYVRYDGSDVISLEHFGTSFAVTFFRGSTSGSNNASIGLAADTWYTIKLRVLGNTIQGKIWNRSIPEPSTWQVSLTNANVGNIAANSTVWQVYNSAGETVDVDNYLVTNFNASVIARAHGQAQAFIIKKGNAHGQARAFIVKVYSQYAQAEAYIYQPQPRQYAQAQAYIRGRIVYDTFTRTLSGELGTPDIGPAYTGVELSPTVGVDGSKLVAGTTTDYAFVDFTAPISFGNGYIQYEVRFNDGADAFFDITARGVPDSSFGSHYVQLYYYGDTLGLNWYGTLSTENEQITVPFTVTAGVTYVLKLELIDGLGRAKLWDKSQTEPDWLLSTNNIHLQSAPDGDVEFYVEGYDGWEFDNLDIVDYGNQTIITGAFGQARAFIFAGVARRHGQARARITGRGNRSGQAQAYIRPRVGTGQAQAQIKLVRNGFGQAQAQIASGVINVYGQARAVIKSPWAWAQTQAHIVVRTPRYGQANAYIKILRRGVGQARARIHAYPTQHGQAQAVIDTAVGYGFGQALAVIKRTLGFGQAQANIKRTSRGHGQARAYIGVRILRGYGQARAQINNLNIARGQAQAYIVKSKGFGQAQAKIVAFGQRAYGNARAFIENYDTIYKSGQANALIFRAGQTNTMAPRVGQARALITRKDIATGGTFNGYPLPGALQSTTGRLRGSWVQSESLSSVQSIEHHEPPYEGASIEDTGLANKTIILRFLVVGETYDDVKRQIETAYTILRSKRGFAKLYHGFIDRYYMAMTTSIEASKAVGTSMKMMEYTVTFECHPWLYHDFSDEKWFL